MDDPIKEERHEMAKDKKKFGYMMIAAVLVLVVSVLTVGFNGGIVGYAIYDTFESNNSVSGSSSDETLGFVTIPNFKISAGDKFKYQVEGWGIGIFRDDTALFDVTEDGLIEFVPDENDVGTHNVWIIMKDKKRYHYQNVVFVIEE